MSTIIEAILYFCEECQTVSLDGGICIQCGEPLQCDTFVPKAAQHSAHPTGRDILGKLPEGKYKVDWIDDNTFYITPCE